MNPTLQISQGEGRRIEIRFAGSASDRRVASTHLDFSLGLKEQDSLRWYWEDYLEHPNRTTRRMASEVEKQLQQLGERLFQRVFQGSEAQQIWTTVAPQLAATRIEIIVPTDSPAPIPWELMRDPLTGATLATKSHSFVRRLAADVGTAPAANMAEAANPLETPLRILLVSCQPSVAADPPFRSAARLLVQSLAGEPSSLVLDVLRPPTFGQLTSVLLEAEALGEPYHAVHFDGHAVAADIELYGIPSDLSQGAGRMLCTRTLRGLHGYMVFDYPTREQSVQLVDGVSMGELLAESRVPLLVLNACQPSRTKEAAATADANVRKTTAVAFESLARAVQTQGVNAVAQLPYHLGPVASAHWLEQIYLALARGASVSEAATAARRRLQEDVKLQISYGPVRREDWPAAVVYEHEALALVRKPPADPLPADDEEEPSSRPEVNVAPRAKPGDDLLDRALPPRPAIGFLGRDDTILAIERALSTKPVVLLHAEEGAGKTTTAAEFARWYAATAGVEGPVLYSSFEHHNPLNSLLDQLGAVFRPSMEAVGCHWRSMTYSDRRQSALNVLEQIPVLWIWDSVDDLGGSLGAVPEGWTQDEREQLAEFLQQAAETQAKFLVTARTAPQDWLGPAAVNIPLGPLPLWEGLQLTRALVEQQGCWPPDIDSWKTVLDFAAGNPLAIQALVTECLRRGFRSPAQFDEFVREVVAEPALVTESGQKAPPGVGSSLSYLLRKAFDEEERSLLALLHLFRGTVDLGLLESMGAQREVWNPKDSAATRRQPRPFPTAPPAAVLDRAASYGLLQRKGDGAYAIHSAMDQAARQIFAETFPAAKKSRVWNQMADRAAAVAAGARTHPAEESLGEAVGAPRGPAGAVVGALAGLGEHGSLTPFGQPAPPEMGPNLRAKFAYVQALSRFGSDRYLHVREGLANAVTELAVQEPNLRHACRLAGDQEWWEPAAGVAEGLGVLYEAEGRLGEWEGMVETLWALCADGPTAPAIPGRERLWRTITEQSVRIARQRDRLPRAEQLQRLCVDWDRRQAEMFDAVPQEADPARAGKVRTLAESLFGLSEILREEGTPAIVVEEEAIELRERLGEKRQASIWAFELGAIYTETPSVRNLPQAERWLKRSLELIHDDDPAAKAECLAALGRVAWERFNEARRANAPETELRRHLTTARQYYQLALEHDLPEDWGKLASHNQQLGHVSYALGDIDRALPHYRESIRCDELHGNTFGAAQTRFNLAIALRDVDRLAEARKFARSAHEDFVALRLPAKGMLERCEKLVANIEERLNAKRRERGVLNGG